MKRIFVIDTNSLINFVLYYLPFDKGAAINRLEELFNNKTIILLESVKDECSKSANGIAAKNLPFLKNVKFEKNIPASGNQHQKINADWRNTNITLQKGQFNRKKKAFVDSGDAQLILYSLNNQSNNVVIVTEESTETINMNNAFLKIPHICQMEHINYINLPEMLKKLGINWHVKIKKTK